MDKVLFNSTKLPKKVMPNEALEVVLAPEGVYEKNDVNQILDRQAFETLISNFKDEVLVDVDHSSVFGDSTEAYAWIEKIYINDLEDGHCELKGVMRFTDIGANAISAKRYRRLSPAWTIDDNGRPEELVSVGLTNSPNLPVPKILNSKSQDDIVVNDLTKGVYYKYGNLATTSGVEGFEIPDNWEDDSDMDQQLVVHFLDGSIYAYNKETLGLKLWKKLCGDAIAGSNLNRDLNREAYYSYFFKSAANSKDEFLNYMNGLIMTNKENIEIETVDLVANDSKSEELTEAIKDEAIETNETVVEEVKDEETKTDEVVEVVDTTENVDETKTEDEVKEEIDIDKMKAEYEAKILDLENKLKESNDQLEIISSKINSTMTENEELKAKLLDIEADEFVAANSEVVEDIAELKQMYKNDKEMTAKFCANAKKAIAKVMANAKPSHVKVVNVSEAKPIPAPKSWQDTIANCKSSKERLEAMSKIFNK